jgi:Bardet-Biedl syndrome 1 protein
MSSTILTDPWLQAFHDPVAGLKCFGQAIRFVDLAGDGDFRLIVADLDKRLKVFRGTGVSSTHTLLEQPVAAAVFYPDNVQPRTPSIAIAAGAYVYIYRNLRPYLKFSLPHVKLSSAEIEASIIFGSGSPASASSSSSSSSSSSNSPQLPSHKATVVTCMEVIQRDREGEGEASSIIIGTEASQIIFMDSSGAGVERTPIDLPSVPTLLVVHGILKGEHRINIACRDNVIYAIKDRELTATRIEPPAVPVCMARTETHLYVASQDRKVTAYLPKGGKKAFTLPMPAHVTAMARMLVRRERASDCVAIALEGGEVKIYNGSTLITTLHNPDSVVAMRFGQYGREANTLALIGSIGSLSFKMIKRTASFEVPATIGGGANSTDAVGAPAEQDIPLALPKKTRLYLEQTQRERDSAGNMYRILQKDLLRLRLVTAKAYAKAMADGLGVEDLQGTSPRALAELGPKIRVNCSVRGLGPRFKLSIDLVQGSSSLESSSSATPLFDVFLTFIYPPSVYHMDRSLIVLPVMLPGVHYFVEADISCVSLSGATDVVKMLVTIGNGGGIPNVAALISMPASPVL